MPMIMWIFTQAEPPKIPQPILIVIEQMVEEPVIEEEPVLYTLEEKIADNVNECDEEKEWISAEDATCLSKPVPVVKAVNTPEVAESQPETIKSGSNRAPSGWYSYGWCTYYVSTQRSVGQWNNASEWVWQAQRDGWATGSTPQVGAIAQQANHVAYVRAVHSNGTMTISEMNYEGFGVTSSRTIPASGWRFIY